MSEFDLKVVHKSLRDQYIGLADKFCQMPIYYLSLPVKEELPECMLIRDTISIKVQSKPDSIFDLRIDERYKNYPDLPIYLGLVEYLQKGLPALKGLNHNQKR